MSFWSTNEEQQINSVNSAVICAWISSKYRSLKFTISKIAVEIEMCDSFKLKVHGAQT